jgi:hypothetical protein
MTARVGSDIGGEELYLLPLEQPPRAILRIYAARLAALLIAHVAIAVAMGLLYGIVFWVQRARRSDYVSVAIGAAGGAALARPERIVAWVRGLWSRLHQDMSGPTTDTRTSRRHVG